MWGEIALEVALEIALEIAGRSRGDRGRSRHRISEGPPALAAALAKRSNEARQVTAGQRLRDQP